MLTAYDFDAILSKQSVLVVDGALATELEKRGHDLNHALWSGKTLMDSPESITKVHLDYYVAGADIAITTSYQASTTGLEQHLAISREEAIALIKRSVHVAQTAREDSRASVSHERGLLIAGSVGPYGAYLADGSEYTGTYQSISKARMQDFHRPRIQALVDADVDILALETMPQLAEISALLDLLYDEFPSAVAWLSCTLRDAQHISDGTPALDVLDLVARHNRKRRQVLAFGVNCVPLNLALETCKHIEAVQKSDQSLAIPLICYPNSGEVWDASKHLWSGNGSAGDDIGGLILKWKAAGAKLVGGCCRTGPQHIQQIRNALEK